MSVSVGNFDPPLEAMKTAMLLEMKETSGDILMSQSYQKDEGRGGEGGGQELSIVQNSS